MFKNNTHRGLGNKGFSLVELIIVVAIMAALIAILAPQYIKYVEKSRTTADDTFADELLGAVKIAVTDEDIYTNIPDGGFTVIWATPDDPDAEGAVWVVTTDEPTDFDALLTSSLGAGFEGTDITSNGHADQAYNIYVWLDDESAPAVQGGWDLADPNAVTP